MKKFIIFSLMFMNYVCVLSEGLRADQSGNVSVEVIKEAQKKLSDQDIKTVKFLNTFQVMGVQLSELHLDAAFFKADLNSKPPLGRFLDRVIVSSETPIERIVLLAADESSDKKALFETFGEQNIEQRSDRAFMIKNSLPIGLLRDKAPKLADKWTIEEFIISPPEPLSSLGFAVMRETGAPPAQIAGVIGKKGFLDIL